MSVRAAAKEINDVERPKTGAQNWFRHFKECGTSLNDKLRSGRPSVVEDETLLEMVEQ